MLKHILRSATSFHHLSRHQNCPLSTTTCLKLRHIQETHDGDTTTVEVVETKSDRKDKLLKSINTGDSCPLCKIGVKISYQDVLILEQYMRPDGTVLPQKLTKLCTTQQRRLERCVMQAHWCGLFPDRNSNTVDKSGYKKFKRHWDDDMDMFRLKHKVVEGSWYYIKRYDVGKGGYGGNV